MIKKKKKKKIKRKREDSLFHFDVYRYSFYARRIVGTVFVILLAVRSFSIIRSRQKKERKKRNRMFTEEKVHTTLTGKHEYKMYFKTSSCKADECFTCIKMFPFNPIKTYKIL